MCATGIPGTYDKEDKTVHRWNLMSLACAPERTKRKKFSDITFK